MKNNKKDETKAPEITETKAPGTTETKAPETTETKAPETKALVTAEQAKQIAESRFSGLKNQSLALAGIELDSIVKAVGEQAVKQWKVYAEITNAKSYTEDGFKNVGEFAEKYFGESKSTASHKSTVYNRFYGENATETAKKALVEIGPRLETLYEYSSLTDKEIETYFDEIVKTLKSKDARELAKRIKNAREDGKSADKVEDTFDLAGVLYTPEIERTNSEGQTEVIPFSASRIAENDGVRLTSDDILDALGYTSEDKLFKAKFADTDTTFYIAINPAGVVSVVTATKHATPPKASETVSANQYRVIAKMHAKGFVSDDIADTLEIDVDKVERIIAEIDAK